MAFSYVKRIGDGTTRTFTVPFPYIQRSHVTVKVNGTAVSFSWTANQTVQLSVPKTPAVDALIEIRRYTPTDTALVDFVDGATLTERDLDLVVLQMLYVNQEAIDLAEELTEELEAETEEDLSVIRSTLRSINSRAAAAIAASNNASTWADQAFQMAEAASNIVTNVGSQVNLDKLAAAASATAAASAQTIATNASTTATIKATEAAASATAASSSATAAAASAATAAAAANFDPTDFYLRTEMDAILATEVFDLAQVNGLQAALDAKAAASHTHTVANVTGLQAALDAKAAASHVHTITNVTGLQTALDGKQASGSYAAATHTHTIANVTGLQTALDGKQASGSYAAASHVHTIAQVTSLQTSLDAKANGTTTITAGNGLTGGGSLAANRTLTLGTPGTISDTSTNTAAADTHTHAVSTTLARDQIKDSAVGSVGSYAMLKHQLTAILNPGSTVSGADLMYSTASGINTSTAVSGTWRCMGYANGAQVTLFLRIS